MMRKRWNPVQRPTSAVHAMRLCKDRALIVLNLSVDRIADLMGVTHDSLYKWLATGRMPAISIPAFELACGCHYVSQWLSTSAGKLVIDMPRGRKVSSADVMEVNTSCATGLALLTAFYAAPESTDPESTLAALRNHLEQVAYHHHNVSAYTTPELEF